MDHLHSGESLKRDRKKKGIVRVQNFLVNLPSQCTLIEEMIKPEQKD